MTPPLGGGFAPLFSGVSSLLFPEVFPRLFPEVL
jgi:hypothetical protein